MTTDNKKGDPLREANTRAALRALRAPLGEELVRELASELKAVAHPIRLKILELLEGGEKTVSQIQTLLGTKQSLTSRQLQILKRNDILQDHREGTQVYYSLKNHHMLDLLDCIRRNRT